MARLRIHGIFSALGIAFVMVVACADPMATGPEPSSAKEILWRLRVAPRGITIAVGQSLTLRPIILNILGEPMTLPDSVAVAYRSADSSRVTVSADGVVTGRFRTPTSPGRGQVAPIAITASLRAGEVVKADTIYVAVTDTAPTYPPSTLSIVPAQPYPADSTWSADPTTKVIPISVRTTTGEIVPDPFLYLHTERWRNGLKEHLSPKTRLMLFLRPPGRFWIYATGWVHGVEFHDSVEYVQMDFLQGGFDLLSNPANSNEVRPLGLKDDIQYIPPCGTFFVSNRLPFPVDLTFDNPSATAVCAPGDETGNLIALQPNQSAIRKLRNSGVYTWRITRTGGPPLAKPFTGKVHVRAHTDF